MDEAILWVFRGEAGEEGGFYEYRRAGRGGHGRPRRHPLDPGSTSQPDLAARWNCKAAKCGSCSAEVNGQPQPHVQDAPVTTSPRASPSRSSRCGPSRSSATSSPTSPGTIEVNEAHHALHAAGRRAPGGRGAGSRRTSSASQEFRKCIECFLCQDVCHVLRNHETRATSSSVRASSSAPPAWRCTRSTQADRVPYLKDDAGIGYCNITKCCTDVCPEHIQHHRQRHHPAQGARRRRVLRPRSGALAQAARRAPGPRTGDETPPTP